LTGQQSKLTEKLENSAPNMFLVVNEPEEQEISVKKSNISRFWELVGTCMEFSPVSRFFWLANNEK
jgi:hypothetical protein